MPLAIGMRMRASALRSTSSGRPAPSLPTSKRDRFAPIDFPGREDARFAVVRFVDAGRERANVGDFELGEENRQRHSGKNGQMKSGASGGAQGFWRKRAGGAGLAGSGGDRASGAKGRGGAQNGADITGILHASEDYEKRSARGRGRAKQIIERGRARMNERGDALRVLGVGKAFEKTVGGAQCGKGHFWRC